MSDPVTLARAARENLARGLAALQSPTVPPQVMSVAEPIAQAMSGLHQVEASQGAARHTAGPAALNAARHALAMLQQIPPGYPAVDQALEAIAGSLSLIHQLAQAPAAAAPPAYPAQPQAAFAGTVAMSPGPAAPPTQPSPQGWAQQPAQPQQPAYAPQQAYQQQPPAYQQPAAAAQHQQPAYQAAPAAAPSFQQAARPAAPAGPAGGPLRFEAELGAHSTTNFYKGLSGNDVIDSGGIFVATYQIPDIGTNVVVKVSMPGGYEFEALGVVRWTREAPLSGSDSPPGFGAQFTQISPEGRQLVYRYVRNREPLFHDDL